MRGALGILTLTCLVAAGAVSLLAVRQLSAVVPGEVRLPGETTPIELPVAAWTLLAEPPLPCMDITLGGPALSAGRIEPMDPAALFQPVLSEELSAAIGPLLEKPEPPATLWRLEELPFLVDCFRPIGR